MSKRLSLLRSAAPGLGRQEQRWIQTLKEAWVSCSETRFSLDTLGQRRGIFTPSLQTEWAARREKRAMRRADLGVWK